MYCRYIYRYVGVSLLVCNTNCKTFYVPIPRHPLGNQNCPRTGKSACAPHQMLKSRFWTWKLVDATCIASFRIRDLLRWFSLSVVGAKVGLHPPSVPRIQRKLQIYILNHKQKFNKRDFSITWSQSITRSTRNRESALKRTLSVYLLYFRKKVDSLSSRWELISALSSSSSVSSFSRPSLSSFRQKASFSRQRRRRRQRRKGRNGLRLPKVPFCPPPN